MSSSATIPELDPQAVAVRVGEATLDVDFADGRTISVPLEWFPRLTHGTAEERRRVRISGLGLYWPDLDEEISIRSLLLGRASGESQKSLDQWLRARATGRPIGVKRLPLPRWASSEPKVTRTRRKGIEPKPTR